MKHTNEIIIALFCALISMSNFTSQRVKAQDSENEQFYVLTSNIETLSTTLWEAEVSSRSLHEIYSIDSTESVSPRSDFPVDEITDLDSAQSAGSVPLINPDGTGFFQHISGAWLVDTQEILVLEQNEVCDRVNGGYCYGYYDFVLVDMVSGQATSLYKLSYHGSIFDSWECIFQRGLVVNQVLPNPVHDQVAVEVKAFDCSSETKQPAAGIIIDFSNATAQITNLPQAAGLSWSPDGSYLAYFVRPACLTSDIMSVNVLPVNPDGQPITLRDEPQYCQNTMFVGWADNETVVYPWKPGSNDSEVPSEFFSHDITTNETSTVDQERILFDNTLFRLADTEDTVLLGNQYNGELAAISTQDLSDVQSLSLGTNQVFYNSRFNQYMFTDLSDTDVLRVNADLSTNTIDLSSLMTQIPKERVFYITPGHP